MGEKTRKQSSIGKMPIGNIPMGNMQRHGEQRSAVEILLLFVLALYPMRHINWGLDFWDTGYNYANFEYMGLEHMDSMWLFSTYLANAVGRFFARLPFGSCLMGMNFYTGLFASALAIGGYLFCTKKLGMPSGIAFLGEIAALSLCWCPTALLYNYLTYVFFLVCVILLYEGLTREKKWCLYAAGLCLGSNVLVRFSNLPEAALIVAVWAYGVIEALESKRKVMSQSKTVSAEAAVDEGKAVFQSKAVSAEAAMDEDEGRSENFENTAIDSTTTHRNLDKTRDAQGTLGRTVYRTLWCLGGYLTALGVLFSYVQLRYGMNAYVEGVKRLFAMTDNAPDYKATSMLRSMFDMYLENLYWAIRILVIVAAGMVMFAVAEGLVRRMGDKAGRILRTGSRILWCAVCLAMLGWLYYRGFCSLEFYAYGSMIRPGVLFLMLTMGIAAIRIFHKKSPKEEKLISGLIILVVLLTSIGSNNKLYPSLNNLFLAAPYTLWQSYGFIRYVGNGTWKGIVLSSFPAKGVLTAFLCMFVVQSFLFGANFMFAEATGVQEVTAKVENNEILKGIRMNPERAKWVSEISEYVGAQELAGRDVILYGQIPAMSYYLQMPAAFNSWSELDSYSIETMEKDMAILREKMEKDASYRPVVILENQFILYWQGGREALEGLGVEEVRIQKVESLMENGKWQLIENFLQDYGYENTFRNEKFGIWK